MKVRIPFQIILLFFCLLFFSLVTFAQDKPQALKFDEFDDVIENQLYSYRKELTFNSRVERFSKQLEKERGITAYIVFYRARITYQTIDWRDFGDKVFAIRNQILYNKRIKVKDVVVMNGGYRENNSVEFWIVPENVELPAPTPAFNKWESYICPTIYVRNEIARGEIGTIRFSVGQYNFLRINEYSLTWKVSGGEIISGQNTNDIEVRLNNTDPKRIIAYVEVGGLPFPCPKVFSATAEARGKLYLVDNFELITNGDLRSRLDNFLMNIWSNPTSKGYVIIYGSRAGKKRDVISRTTYINNHFAFRNFDVSRITVINGGFREELSSQLWLSLDNAEKPIPTPTVDEKFIVVPKPARKPRPRRIK